MSSPADLPAVGIVVLNYNGWRHTVKCLESLQHLDYPRASVLVVDNRSTDDSVPQLRQAFPSIELIESPDNLGFAAGNNLGIARFLERQAQLVWLLNNDALADPHAVGEMVRVAQADPRIASVGSVIYDLDRRDHVQAWGGGMAGLWTGHTRLARGPQDRVDYITGASLLLRSAALREVGLLDEGFFFQWEDADLGLRLRRRGWKLAVAPGAKVWHVGGGSDPGLSPFRIRHHASGLVRFMRKHAFLPPLATLPIFAYYLLTAARHRSPALLRAALGGWCAGWHGRAPRG